MTILLLLSLFLTQAPYAVAKDPHCGAKEIAQLADGTVRKTEHLKPVAETKRVPADPSADQAAFLAGKEYRMGTFNVENLFSSVGKFLPDPKTGKREKVKDADVKPERDRKGVAKAILDMNLDVAMLQEVELNAVEEFCAAELGGKYQAITIRGNDGRGIDVVAIVKKGSALEFTYHSHKNEPFSHRLYGNRKLFSRDVVALEARLPGHDKPLFVFLGLHGKSKRTEFEADPQSNDMREAQGERLADIAQLYLDKYGAPVFIGGDFNDSPHRSRAYRGLREMGFKDAFDVSQGEKIPAGDRRRITHTYHPRGEKTEYSQLDAMLVSPDSQDMVLQSHVYQYLDDRGRPMPIPDTYEQRDRQPSDHRPTFMVIDWQKLLKKAGLK